MSQNNFFDEVTKISNDIGSPSDSNVLNLINDLMNL